MSAARTASNNATFPVLSPASLEEVGSAPDHTLDDVEAAIERSAQAFDRWGRRPADERAEILLAAATIIRDRVEDLARLITLESGKALADSRGEAATTAKYLQWSGEEARRIYGRVIAAPSDERRFMTLRQPVGLTVAITPWNFPMSLVARKLGPALAAGCSVVLRPSSSTPLSAYAVADALAAAGLPEGVLEVVTTASAAQAGELLTTHPLVRKVTFTGGTEVGKHLMALATRTVKRISMELGGNAPFLVLEDADLDAALAGMMAAKFRSSGQTCTSANRIYVHQSLVEAFSERLAEAANHLTVGDGMADGTDMGPLINAAALEKVEAHVGDAIAAGARVIAGGERLNPDGLKGAFYQPTVLVDVPPDAAVLHEETFGPIAPVVSISDDEEALRLANATNHGLAAYVYTRDIGRAHRVMERLDYGIVGVNDPFPFAAQFPMGGWKESGVGFENGTEGVESFVQTKAVSFGL